MLPVAEKEVLAIRGSSNMHWMVLKKVKEVCIWVAMAVMLIVPVQVMSGRHKGQAQEIRVQKYNRYFLESICQKALGNSSAQYDLLTERYPIVLKRLKHWWRWLRLRQGIPWFPCRRLIRCTAKQLGCGLLTGSIYGRLHVLNWKLE